MNYQLYSNVVLEWSCEIFLSSFSVSMISLSASLSLLPSLSLPLFHTLSIRIVLSLLKPTFLFSFYCIEQSSSEKLYRRSMKWIAAWP